MTSSGCYKQTRCRCPCQKAQGPNNPSHRRKHRILYRNAKKRPSGNHGLRKTPSKEDRRRQKQPLRKNAPNHYREYPDEQLPGRYINHMQIFKELIYCTICLSNNTRHCIIPSLHTHKETKHCPEDTSGCLQNECFQQKPGLLHREVRLQF